MKLVIDSKGLVRCVYGETLELASLGSIVLQRASHVEPNSAGGWTADLMPVHGPVLGPFDRRSKALAAERAWLEEHWLLGGSS
jgi:hypothetical protein